MRRRVSAGIVGTALLLIGSLLAACAPQRDPDPQNILVWSLDAQTDRIQALNKLIARFNKTSEVDVRLVPVDEAQLPQLIAGAAQSGNLPDVIGGLSLANVRALDSYEVLDRGAATAVMEDLGEDTFAERAVRLTSDGEENLAVPSDAWAQLIVYRKDLFEQAGLQPPDSYDNLLTAARELNRDGRFGITIASDPADVFTAQTFEMLALANGCQMVRSSGEITIGDPECVRAFELYGKLASDYSPAGTETVDTTRASYFSGQAAMVIWSSFILDEMAGLRSDALPTCSKCEQDPSWLAKNSGVVSALTGPDNSDPAGFGEIASWGLTDNGKQEAAQEFVSWMLSDGYEGWLAITPEGKYPARLGPEPGNDQYARAWPRMEAGVDKREPLSDFYTGQTLDSITSVTSNIDRWAIPQGQGRLLGPVVAELPFSRAASSVANGSLTPREAADEVAGQLTEIQESQ